MKKLLLLVILFASICSGQAQNEKGYYVKHLEFPQNATLLHAFHTMQCCGHYVMHVTSIDYFFDRSLSSRDLSNHFQFYLHQIGNLTQKTPSIT